ncbi:hypothetical protein CON65_15260 [Bacillus pseudomycoides]|uniref:Uncharacterized protein n=1 Tax=Bacillus pseudomycoides TaxID=64104 RepID=A0AA91ZSL7_9BACI|nr:MULTISPECIES: hypothetical protein [Bacillus]PEB51877.1 hypothetical protein COO03_14545 [Bacillus sp. AFS098217]PED81836.1 hypothetical protein CON65_15260 [Bacillus pseudomycoides]PEU15264.1 hypothetical protein CN525_17765 [Bacillus sp. AFS014408]PEU17867.1 hypothetical protein CN524_01030 [Bacillus sp. AFS019443]PFW63336.1 hypothetical protein COL20_09170 [Bacillus sp. AFS075034]
MKPDFLQAVHKAIGNIEHIHIEESGSDSLLIHHDDVQKLQQVAETLENQKFHSTIRNNGNTSFIEVINR